MTLKEVFSKTAFLLGAGASFESKCLISSKMLECLKTSILNIAADDPHYGKYKKGFLELYKVIHPALAYQSDLRNINAINDGFYKPNIEDFILILRKIINRDHIIPEPLVGSWSDRLTQIQFQNQDILESYLSFLYQCIIGWITPDDDYKSAKHVLRPLRNLFNSTHDEDYVLNMFTLNYDLTIERTFNVGDEKVINTGFSKNSWEPQSFNTPNVRVNLYKIHGSIDWYRKFDNTLSTNNHELAYNFKDPNERRPHIILGYENKLFSVDPFFTLVQKFIKAIDEANLVVVIGYSFFDSYLNNILIQCINNSENKQLLVVDPSWAGKTPEEFTDYIKHIQSDVSTLNLYNYQTFKSSRIALYKAKRGAVSGASTFYKEYFANKSQMLVELHNELSKNDTPF